MDFIILSLFFLMVILFILGLSYLDICFKAVTRKFIIISSRNMLSEVDYKRYQGKYHLALSGVLLIGIIVTYLVKAEALSTHILNYWTMALLVFSIVYGRSSRKYFNSQRSKRKKL
jgi:phosphatidylserine synthase